MEKEDTQIEGLYLVKFSPNVDERGFFVRNHCVDEFSKLGIKQNFIQSSLSFNKSKGTMRGLHLQTSPREEVKIIQCLSGKIYDVILDLRPSSKTFKKWQSFELSLEKLEALYVPGGCAHGFITLTNDVLIQYRMNENFFPEFQIGVRWDDPTFDIKWPLKPVTISSRDENFPNYVK